MFTVVVQEKGGKSQRLQFNKGEITIGRVQGNDIVLPKGNVSKRHSKIVFKEGKFIVVDLKSTNGTYVNGHKIASPQVIKGTDKVFVGDFVIEIEDGSNGEAAAPGPGPGMPPGPPGPGPGMPPGPPGPGPGMPPGPPGPGPGMPPGPPGGPPPMGARPPMPGPMTGPQPPMPGGPGPGPMGGPPPMGARPPMPPGPGGPPGMPPGGPGPMGGPPPMGARPPMPGPSPTPGPGPSMGMQPPARAGAWNEVAPQGGPSYHYLSVQGGWLISSASGLVFISDVQHQHPPIPS